MKRNADKGNSVDENNTPKQRKTSSKNGEIETYLSSYYEPQFGISKACFCLKIVSIKAQKEDYFSYICC